MSRRCALLTVRSTTHTCTQATLVVALQPPFFDGLAPSMHGARARPSFHLHVAFFVCAWSCSRWRSKAGSDNSLERDMFMNDEKRIGVTMTLQHRLFLIDLICDLGLELCMHMRAHTHARTHAHTRTHTHTTRCRHRARCT